jgi:hypothetical protein
VLLKVPQTPARPLAAVAALTLTAIQLIPSAARAQDRPPVPDFTGIVKDEGWARILGKALFWDTVARASGSDCSSCHFVTGANRRIPDRPAPTTQVLRASTDGPVAQWLNGPLAPDDRNGIVDVCSRQVTTQPAEVPDSGPLHAATRVADEDSSCKEDLTVRLAHSLLVRKPLDERSINPDDATFGPAGPHGNLVSPTGHGLERTYQWMIEQAFEDPLWRATDGATPQEPSRVEKNFQLFWGISVLLYESTLDPHWIRDHEAARSLAVPAATHGQAEWE